MRVRFRIEGGALNCCNEYVRIEKLRVKNLVYGEFESMYLDRDDMGFSPVNLTDNYLGTASAQGQYNSYGPTHAFDNGGNYWYHNSANTYIQYSFTEGKRFVLTSYSINVERYYFPNNWTLEGSNDGINWEIIDHQEGHSWSDYQWKNFVLYKSHEPYSMFRIDVVPPGEIHTRIREIDFFGFQMDIPYSVELVQANYGEIAYQQGVPEFDNSISKAWLIQPLDGSDVVLTIEEFIPKHSNDLVRIYNGKDHRAPILAEYRTASTSTTDVYSTVKQVYIEYISIKDGSADPNAILDISYESAEFASSYFPWVYVNQVGYALDNHKLTVNSTNVNTQHELYVDGSIGAEEIVIEVVNAPDYVFEEDYDLKSLQEVRKHISDMGHLPEVPSALEMEENGISLSEMNMLLLKKIEELTLYILDQEERIKKLESKK